jgi:tRNA nucleotidyltransferase/poly(A) polymerase
MKPKVLRPPGAPRRKKLALAAAFRRRSLVATLIRVCREHETAVWLVGGAPRDALLDRPALDLDVAVPSRAEAVARALAEAGFGTFVALSEEPPRVFRVAGRRILDVAELERPTIAEDLARRDFTANAIAVDLSTGEWVDPFGGIADIMRQRLRLVRRENLADDPLRTFRAARFYATHGLVPDRAVRQACRDFGPQLEGVAPERVGAELTRLLEAPRIAPAWRFAIRTGLLSPALRPRTRPARWRAALRVLARLELGPVGALSPERRRVLRLAAIADSLGLGPAETRAWLRRLRRGASEAGRVARVLEAAQTAVAADSHAGPWAWLHDVGPEAGDALSLLAATRPRAKPLVRRLRAALARARRGPEVSGGDLIGWTGIAPGPEVGRLLRELRIEILSGHVRSRREARGWSETRLRRS